MLKVNFDKLSSVANRAIYLSLKDRMECTLEEYIHEPNTRASKECIKANIESLLEEAKQNAIKEGKYYIVNGGHKVYPADLNPLVFVDDNPEDSTTLVISYNYDGKVLADDIFNEDCNDIIE